uniref:Uncharacterized protein n=1 Tax=Octopus bimaculoides TaxID=37653 RepID=A0A0L8GGW9_OCTBM
MLVCKLPCSETRATTAEDMCRLARNEAICRFRVNMASVLCKSLRFLALNSQRLRLRCPSVARTISTATISGQRCITSSFPHTQAVTTTSTTKVDVCRSLVNLSH